MTASKYIPRECPTPWLGARRGYLTDLLTQMWVRGTGRRVDLTQDAWLAGPAGTTNAIGESFIQLLATNHGLSIRANHPGAGLMRSFDDLRSEQFDPQQVDPRIRQFYEHTVDFQLDLWSEWCGFFRPFGRLLAFLFSRRLQQLNVPLSPLSTSRGITSDLIQLIEQDTGAVAHTAWLRKFISTGEVIYAGFYTVCVPPRIGIPCVKVVFPLPNGSATVIMRPQTHADGSFTIVSSGSGFGDAGFYFLVQRPDGKADVRLVKTMRESIHVHLDGAGDLRADHIFRLWGMIFMRLHYKMNARTHAHEGAGGRPDANQGP